MRTQYSNDRSRAKIVQARINGAPGLLEITRLWTDIGARRKGYATALLTKICADADRHAKVMVVRPEPFGEKGLTELVGWYKRFGFTKLQDGPALMARAPQILKLRVTAEASKEMCRA